MLVQIQNLNPAAKDALLVKKQVGAGQPLQLKTQPGMRLELTVDGVKQTGKLQSPGVGQFKLKRVGADLLVVDAQEQTLCELLEFFESSDVTLIGQDWTFVGGTTAELANVAFTDLGLYSRAADVALAGAAPAVVGSGGPGAVGGAGPGAVGGGGLGAFVGFGAAVGLGASGQGGSAQVTYTIGGQLFAGPIVANPGGDLVVRAYNAAGVVVGSATVNADGTYSMVVTVNAGEGSL
jgi:hypothetical protein